jgi:hypothetical protein
MTEIAKEFLIEIENRPGSLATVSQALGISGVNIRSLTIDRIGNQGFIRVIVDDDKRTEKALDEKGFMYTVNNVIVKHLKDRPGELARVAQMLSTNNVNIEAVYMVGKNNGLTQLVFALDNIERGQQLLKAV